MSVLQKQYYIFRSTSQAPIFKLYQSGKPGNIYTMKSTPLSLDDLVPQETTFKLSTMPDKELGLRRWSLRARKWAIEKYGAAELQRIFQEKQVEKIAALAYFLLRDEDQKLFKTEDDFLDAISTINDQIELIKAILRTIGIGEPQIEKINELEKLAAGSADPNAQSPN